MKTRAQRPVRSGLKQSRQHYFARLTRGTSQQRRHRGIKRNLDDQKDWRLARRWIAASLVTICLACGHPLWAVGDPLEPLSKEEIVTAMKVLQANGKVGTETRFPVIALREPSKTDVLSY